jgi:type IV pilus assembly protein PilY1
MKALPAMRKTLFIGFVSILALCSPAILAETTDLWTAPFEQDKEIQVKPNLMFVMDDSGSMGWDFMPDQIGPFVDNPGAGKYYYGFRSSQCNGLGYNPAQTYLPPLDYTGSSYPNATFTGAWKDGYNTASGTVNLTGSVYYTYTGTQTTEAQRNYYNSSSTFFKECSSLVGSAPGSGVFTAVTVSSTSGPGATDERTNYANWYSYYRIRVNLMKSGTSHAFKGIDDRYRVGYMSINNNGGTDFLNIDTFDSDQKKKWYDLLLKQKVSDSTPTRSALALAGRIFANKLDSYNSVKVVDPMQYSCQRNFAILSTDGFWNSGACHGGSAGCFNSGRGTKLDGSDIGDQDGGAKRPYFDGNNFITTVVDKTVTKKDRSDTKPRDIVDRYVDTNRTINTTLNHSRTLTLTRTRVVTAGCGPGVNTKTISTATTTETQVTKTTTDAKSQLDTTTNYLVTTPYSETITHTVTTTTTAGTTTVTTADTDTGFVAGSPTQTVTSGPTTVTTGLGSTVTGPTTTTSYAPYTPGVTAVGSISWTVTSTTCVTTGTTDGYVVSGTGAWVDGSTGTTGPTLVSHVHQTGYPTTTDGTTTTGTEVVTGPTTTTTTTTTGTTIPGTMADIAYYYYNTDLRTPDLGNEKGVLGLDVASNEFIKDGTNRQNMTTFTVGLGVRGRLIYRSDYDKVTTGDYYNVSIGTVNDGSSVPCSWAGANKTCNWPVPKADTPEAVDDLWHAAVNGGGRYFSATDAKTLSDGLTQTFKEIEATTGAAAAASTSQQVISSKTTTYMFRSTFKSSDWYGELIRQTIDSKTGEVPEVSNWDDCPADVCDWSARKQLNALVDTASDTRSIYTYDPTNDATRLKDFAWASLTDAEKKLFVSPQIDSLTQFADFDAADKAAAEGANLVAFLRGQRGYEGKYYRTRKSVLGDIVSSEAVYVTTPPYSYGDQGYTAFATAQATRKAVVYVGSNDGMLHAFDVDTGKELWAYVPSHVLPKLYNLADAKYSDKHTFFVDGSPVVGDVCVSNCGTDSAVWKTILVGGLNAGGRGYYALDITDPDKPKALWEFTYDTSKGAGYTTDADLGFTFGNPIITKRVDGTWVVLVTSGYNNVSPGSGEGVLFVLDAAKGEKMTTKDASAGRIGTGVGSDTSPVSGACSTPPCPSGLAMISAWADSARTDNTTTQVYGGDLYGNLWRFDINDTLGVAGYDAQHLATFQTGADQVPPKARQPVAVPPELAEIDGQAVIFVGTGKLLGDSDLGDTMPQSMYAIKDTLGTEDWDVVRGRDDMVQQTLKVDGDVMTGTSLPVDWKDKIGWFFDLPRSGERANTQPALARGILVFNTNQPQTSTCFAGGVSYQYQVDYRTGGPDATSGINIGSTGTLLVGTKLASALATRVTLVELQLDGGQSSVKAITVGRDGKLYDTDVGQGHTSSIQKRVSWRELFSDK